MFVFSSSTPGNNQFSFYPYRVAFLDKFMSDKKVCSFKIFNIPPNMKVEMVVFLSILAPISSAPSFPIDNIFVCTSVWIL